MDAGAFGGGVKTVIAYQDPSFQEVVVEFVHVGHELGIGECAFVFRGFDDDHESHFVCPFGLSRAVVQVHSLIAAQLIVEREDAESTRRSENSPWLLVNALTVHVGTSRHFSGNPTNQDLASQNVPTSLLTRNNCRSLRRIHIDETSCERRHDLSPIILPPLW